MHNCQKKADNIKLNSTMHSQYFQLPERKKTTTETTEPASKLYYEKVRLSLDSLKLLINGIAQNHSIYQNEFIHNYLHKKS